MDYDDAVATFASPRPAGTPLPEVVGAGGGDVHPLVARIVGSSVHGVP